MKLSIDEIKEILYSYFDIDEDYGDDEKGCYLGGKWLSIGERKKKSIRELL